MSKQTINIGASPNDGTGTPLRTSFDYTNQNFTEIYTALGGGVALPGATTQVIFNDGGTNLAGDAGLVYNKTTDALTVAGLVTAGSATITGALTLTGGTANGVPYLNASKVVTTGTNLSFANTPGVFDSTLNINSLLGSALYRGGITVSEDNTSFTLFGGSAYKLIQASGFSTPNQLSFYASNAEQYRIGASGVFNWYDGVGGTRMTLNSTGLGVGVSSPSQKLDIIGSLATRAATTGANQDVISIRALNLDASAYANAQYYANSQKWYYAGASFGMALDASGNLLVGTTSTSGSSSNATSVVLGSARSADGTVSATTAVATTIFSITAGLRGRYEVVAMIPNSGSAALYTSIATVIWDGNGGRIVANNGTNLTITLSVSDVQITQTAGTTQTVYWSFLRISLA